MMDELDLARRAVRRSLLSEEQLREAQAYAAGGRSLLSVLLDLGYLWPQDVSDLATQRPSQTVPQRSTFKTLGLIVVTALVTVILSRSCSEETVHYQDRVVFEPVQPERSVGMHLAVRGSAMVKKADEQVKRAGLLSAEMELEVRQAAALLTEAATQGSGGAATFSALARAHEMLDHWESAAEWYRKALNVNDRDEAANLGLARVLLFLDRAVQAHHHATEALTGETAAEAFLVRAKASMSMGDKAAARADLEMALQRDPSLREQVRALQLRLDE